MPTNVITLPHRELYEPVWSKPVTELAKAFGISGVALWLTCGIALTSWPIIIANANTLALAGGVLLLKSRHQ